MFKAEMIRCWHPDSPGSTIICRRRFRKKREFATLTECTKYSQWSGALVNNYQVRDVRPR
jgi:hypothetical protein